MALEIKTGIKAAANRGTRMVVLHPATRKPWTDADGKEAALIVGGRDADAWRVIEDEIAERNAAEYVAQGKEWKGVSAETERADQLRKVVAVTTGWENLSVAGSETFSADALTTLFTEEPWLLDDAHAWAVDREHFIAASKTT